MSEKLSLEQAHQLIGQLRTRQADLEAKNQELSRELEALKTQIKNRASDEGPHSLAPEVLELTLAPHKGLLRCIIDTIGDLIYVKDIDGVYRGCNKASESFIGLTEAEQIGKTDFDFFGLEKAKEIQEVDRRIIASGQEHCIEEWVLCSGGRRVLLESKKAPFYGPDGEVVGIVGISRDITARKNAEDALKKANQELDAFVYTISHDLRTPLTPIIGYAEMLLYEYKGILDVKSQLFLTEIISSAEKMQKMMADILSMATVGQVDNQIERLDVGDVVRKVIRDLSGHLSIAGVSFKITNLPSLAISETLLIQVFDNLIVNAMKYGCVPGDVIEIGYEYREKMIVLYVRDHGPGIPVDQRDRVFEPFFRGSIGREKPGTGIGLTTVRKIAKICGGDAWAEETPGGGATICFALKGEEHSFAL